MLGNSKVVIKLNAHFTRSLDLVVVEVIQLSVGFNHVVNRLAIVGVEERLVESGDVRLCVRIENWRWDAVCIVGQNNLAAVDEGIREKSHSDILR